jgi:hypothetical protein
MYGQPHTGAWAFPIPDLEVGDELVVALEWKLTAWVPTRIVNTGGRSIVQDEKPALDDEEMWVPGFDNSDEPIAIGDLIIENITFSADDGSGRTSKRRPCVVIAVTDSEIRLLPSWTTGGGAYSFHPSCSTGTAREVSAGTLGQSNRLDFLTFDQ